MEFNDLAKRDIFTIPHLREQKSISDLQRKQTVEKNAFEIKSPDFWKRKKHFGWFVGSLL